VPCAACSQCCEYISVTLPDLQPLAVTEQTVRSWAAAAAQLRVQITVLGPSSAAEAAKKPGAAAAGAKGGPPAAPAAVASGTLTVQCAGLLAGDTSTVYRWGSLPPAAAEVQEPAASGEATAGAAAAATAAAAPKPPAGQEGCFKWGMQPPTGTLLDWLEAAEVQLQVSRHRTPCHSYTARMPD
jgi:hypothetical protein